MVLKQIHHKRGESEMTKEQCADCVCLVEGFDGTWICDESNKPCVEVKKCPETGEKANNIKE